MSDESDDSRSFFAEEVLQPRLAKAIEQYLPSLASFVSPEEMADLKKVCEDAFERVTDVFDGEDPEDIFRIHIPKLVQDAISEGAAGIRRSLSDLQWIRELGALKRWISGIAGQLQRQEISLTAELRDEVLEKDKKLAALLRSMDAEHPHFKDRSLPKPVLDISYRYMIRMWLSDCINDFRYVKDYPNSRVMSLGMADRIRFGPQGPQSKPPGE